MYMITKLSVTNLFCKKSLLIPTGYSEDVKGRRQTIQWPKKKRTKGETMMYKTLRKKLKIE